MRDKKLFIKFKNAGSKFGDFIDKKGFYIVILLCIMVIGATAAIVSIRDYRNIGSNFSLDNNNAIDSGNIQTDIEPEIQEDSHAWSESSPADEPVKEDAGDTEVEPVQETQASQSEPEPAETEARSESNTSDEDEDSNGSVPESNIEKPQIQVVPDNKPFKPVYPAYGKIINEYAEDMLIFSKTLQQWTTHPGIDISSDKGSTVKAAADGEVKSVKRDPRYGITIIIEHEGGWETVYSNLSTSDMVKPGQKVKQGIVISGVGDTAGFECEDEPHLHFEVLKDGRNVDPTTYLPKQ